MTDDQGAKRTAGALQPKGGPFHGDRPWRGMAGGFFHLPASGEKGFILVTALLMGMVAMSLVGVAYEISIHSTKVSAVEKRYTLELDAARGIAESIKVDLRAANLTCNGGNPCVGDNTCASAASNIDLNTATCTALGKTVAGACANISGCYLGSATVVSGSGTADIVSIGVQSVNASSNETALIDFVYRVQ